MTRGPLQASPRALVTTAAGLLSLGVLSALVITGVWEVGVDLPSRSANLVTSPVGLVFCAVAASRYQGRVRRTWTLFGTSLCLVIAGDVLWVAAGTGVLSPAAHAWSETLYLVALLPAVVALVLYPVLGDSGLWRVLVIDIAVLVSAVVLLCHLLVLRHIYSAPIPWADALVLSLYPLGAALVTALLVLVLMRSDGPVRPDLLMACAVQLGFFLSGTGFSLGSLPGAHPGWLVLSEVAHAVIPLLVGGVALIVAVVPPPRTVLRRHLPSVVASLLPDLSGLLALALASLLLTPDPVSGTLAILTLATVGARQLFQTASGERLRGELERRVAERTQGLAQLREDYRRLDAMKLEFVTAVSHELRTPLAAIHGPLEMLHDGDAGELPAPALSMVGVATRGSERLTRLVNDIIDLERLESGTFGFSPQESGVGCLVADAVEMLQSLAQESGVRLSTRTAATTAWCDPDRVTQVLVNLVGNALKFAPRGSEITVGAERDGDEVLIWVSDQGAGIPPDQLEAIFDRFHQVEMDVSRQRGGAGLGLTICRHIVQRHGGRIWAESDAQGTTFRFTVPASAPAALAALAAPAVQAALAKLA